jgi:photosystem II stability/assembly factor-like uncharacterized protein
MPHLNLGRSSRVIAFNFTSLAILCLLLSLFGINEPVAQATPGTGENGWVWQNPLPQGNPLYGITCPTATNCLAVGDGGTIVATTDGSWTALTSGTTKALRSISCINSTTCYAAGDTGTIVKTTDSGNTWTLQSSGTTANLKKIICFAPDTCYAITNPSLGLLKTDNGGNSWTTILTNNGLRDLTCPSINICFTIDRTTIYKTADSGATWQNYGFNIGGGLYSYPYDGLSVIGCANNTTCYVGVSLGGKGLPPSELSKSVLKTVDSGLSWNSLPNSPPTALFNSYSAILCPDPNTCYLTGGYGYGITKTDDGGATWTFPNNSVDSLYNLNEIACLNPLNCYFVGNYGRIYQTVNGGVTWINKLQGINGYWEGVDCVTNAVCYVAGDGGKILKTVTGGNLWIELNTGTSQNFTAIKCLSTLMCYATGSNSVYKTIDGGSTWNNRSNGISLFLWAISCPARDICYVVGGDSNIYSSNSVIYKTTDGGDNWSSLISPANYPLLAVNCPSVDTCYAGNSGIYKTTDGGLTWSNNQLSRLATQVSSITCLDANVCYAVRHFAGFCSITAPPTPDQACDALLKTTNGGNNWNIGPFSNTYDITCQNLTTCFAVGNDGKIAYTNDGSTTWTYTNAAYGTPFTRISCPSTCTAIGYSTIMSNHNYGCEASLVKNGEDDGTCGTLRYALSVAKDGDTVTFDNNLSTPAVINLNSGLNLPKGVALDAQNKCGPDGPGITLQGNGAPGNGLTLNGNNTLRGLRIEGFGGNQLALNNSKNNRLSCVVLKE